MKLLQTASVLVLFHLTQAKKSVFTSIKETLFEKEHEIEELVENALDFECVLHTDHESCINSIDTKSGGSCNWCTNDAIGGTYGACFSEEQANEIPVILGVTCGDTAPDNTDEKKKLMAEFQGAMSEMIDLSCLIYFDQEACENAEDEEGEGCSWCESAMFPKIKGCLTEEEAEKLIEVVNSTGHADEVGLSCSIETLKVKKEKVKAEMMPDLTCMKITDESSCASTMDATGVACEWCSTVNPAMSMLDLCMSTKDAAYLPASMYQCASLDKEHTFVEEHNMVRAEKEVSEDDGMSFHEFSHVDGVKHILRDSIIDPEFCDPKSPKSVSGYMDITGSAYDKKEEKHLYFWFFEKRTSKPSRPLSLRTTPEEHIPLIIWLTGGPGCSSTLALLFENGPCSVNEDGTTTTPNPHSWNKVGHILFLDQPAGVGFSYSKKDTNEDEKVVGEDVYYFLQSFFKAHPKYEKNPLFVVGESYGGHYAPAVAHRIHQGNRKLKKDLIHINLKGLAVGNGLTDPKVQYQHYAEMAYHNSHDIKTVPKTVFEAMNKATPACIDMINTCTSSPVKSKFFCQVAENFCSMSLIAPFTATGLNIYDIRSKCGKGDLCYDFDNIVKFMNLPSTREALHISDKSGKWETCSKHVYNQFTVDMMKDVSSYVTELIDNDIATLIYAGDTDFICNYLGNKAWTVDLKWKHQKEYKNSKAYDWKKQGLAKSYKGLTFLQVYDAGHMVPHDQPEVALEMITDFVERYS